MAEIPHIKWSSIEELFDSERLSEGFEKIIDIGGKIFSPKDIQDLGLKGIDKLKDFINEYQNTPDVNSFIPEHSEYAKEVFAPFLCDEDSFETMDLISNEGMSSVITFEGINHDVLPIGVEDLGIDASDLIDVGDVADGIDFVDNAADGVDLLSSFEPVTFLLGIAASAGVGYLFKRIHKHKNDKIQELASKISPKIKFLNLLQKDVPVEQSYKLYKSLKYNGEI